MPAVRFALTFSQNSQVFEKLLPKCCTLEKLTRNMLFDYFGARLVPHFGKSQTLKMAKKPGK